MRLNDLFPGKVGRLKVCSFYRKNVRERLKEKYFEETGKKPEGKEYSKYLENFIYQICILDQIRDSSLRELHKCSDQLLESMLD